MQTTQLIRKIIVLYGLILPMPSLAQAQFDLDAQVNVDIPAQPLAGALLELSKQGLFQLVISAGSVAERDAVPLSGKMPIREALERLLRGTNLSYSWVGEHTVTVTARNSAGGADAARAQGPAAATQLARVSDGLPTADDSGAAGSDDKGSATRREDTTSGANAAAKTAAAREMVVTGTHIRGIDNATAPMLVLDREAIEDSGYASVQQLIESIPQNFAGGDTGASEDGLVGSGFSRRTNITGASGFNLRGMGEVSTLVLVNGRRMAPSAYGAVVDVSLIPLNAVERVEILTDGSSAIYGSEAVAGVVNFVLRNDYHGAETRLRFGTTTEGSVGEERFSQSIGGNWSGGNAFVALQYSARDSLPADKRNFTSAAPMPTDVLPKTRQWGAIGRLNHALTDNVEVFADGLFTHRDVDREMTERLASSGLIIYGNYFADVEGSNVSAGIAFEPSASWRIELAGAYSRELSNLGGIDDPPGFVFGDTRLRNDYDILSWDLKADGLLASIAGGEVRMAVGASRREEYLSSYLVDFDIDRVFERNVSAGFAELYIPLIGTRNRTAFARRVDVSLAARYDDYSDFGGTTNPKIGLVWSPFEGLDLRGTYSTSFRAPFANEAIRVQSQGQLIVTRLFSAPGGMGQVPVMELRGSVPALMPEESDNWTLGFTWQPAALPGLDLTLSYFDVDYRERITVPPLDFGALLQPDVYGPLITPLASDAAAQAFVDGILAAGGRFFDTIGSGVAGVRHIYDTRQQNVARLQQSGFDVTVGYDFTLGGEALRARLSAGMINEILTSFGADATAVDLVDSYARPLNLRARAELGWSGGGWDTNVAVNYSDRYRDTTPAIDVPIGSWTTVDCNVRRRFESHQAGPAVLANTALSLSVINLFDTDPPNVVGAGLYPAGYDSANATPLGRMIALELVKEW